MATSDESSLAQPSAISSSDIIDYKALPKVELHAHLSGSISPQCLHDIWISKCAAGDVEATALVDPLAVIGPGAAKGFELTTFFPLFSKYIYTLINSFSAIEQSTRSSLQDFADDGVVYLELRTTPRAISSGGGFPPISKSDYVSLVLETINNFNKTSTTMVTRLILSIDRRNTAQEAEEVVDLALKYIDQGVVGVDLCGNPTTHDVSIFRSAFKRAKEAGLGITLHFGEVDPAASVTELGTLLEFQPDRIGHVIYVPEGCKEEIKRRKLGLELCLSCNVKLGMMKPGQTYTDHHFQEWKETGCPISLSTDDVGIVGSPLSEEYSLVAEHFGMGRQEVLALARNAIPVIFGGEKEKERLRGLMERSMGPSWSVVG